MWRVSMVSVKGWLYHRTVVAMLQYITIVSVVRLLTDILVTADGERFIVDLTITNTPDLQLVLDVIETRM